MAWPDLNEIRQAAVTQLRALVDDVHVYDHVPDNPATPALCVMPDEPWVLPHAPSQGTITVMLRILAIVNPTSTRSAQDRLGRLVMQAVEAIETVEISPGGQILENLGMDALHATVTEISGPREIGEGENTFPLHEIRIRILRGR